MKSSQEFIWEEEAKIENEYEKISGKERWVICECGEPAGWRYYYSVYPYSAETKILKYACYKCVERGCSCQIDHRTGEMKLDEEGRPQTCVNWQFSPDGWDAPEYWDYKISHMPELNGWIPFMLENREQFGIDPNEEIDPYEMQKDFSVTMGEARFDNGISQDKSADGEACSHPRGEDEGLEPTPLDLGPKAPKLCRDGCGRIAVWYFPEYCGPYKCDECVPREAHNPFEDELDENGKIWPYSDGFAYVYSKYGWSEEGYRLTLEGYEYCKF